MVIKEIYVENFGKLSAFSLKLSPDMNSFRFDNGYGKTTLTYFIKAMLYGLDQTTKHSLFENERKRFYPWQGGSFGGYMTFGVCGKDYRVERSFGQKASEDKFALYSLETGKPSTDFSEKLGEEMFGIDKDGFERTVFISELFLSGENHNQTISAKLSDLSGVEGDIADYDNAINLLDKQVRVYKKKGGGGVIKDTEQAINKAKKDIESLKKTAVSASNTESAIREVDERLSVLEAQRREIADKRAELDRIKERQLLRSRLEFMQERVTELQGALSEKERFFGERIPTEDDIYSARDKLQRAESLYALSSSELEVTDESFFEKRSREAADEDLRLGEEVLQKKEALSLTKKETSNLGGKLIAAVSLAAIGILFLLLSAIIHPLFIAPGMAAIIAAAVFAYGYRSKIGLISKHAALKEELNTLESELDKNLSLYPFEQGTSTQEKLALLKKTTDGYDFMKLGTEKAEEKRAAMKAEAESLEKEAKTFVAAYPTKTDHPFDEILAVFKERERLRSDVAAEESAISVFLREHGTALSEDKEVPKTNEQELAERSEEVSGSLIRAEREKAELRAELSHVFRELERSDELDDECARLEAKLTELERRYFALTKARELLITAKDSMRQKYLGLTQKNLEKYLELLGYQKDGIFIDTSFAVYKTELGSTRSFDAYSRGTRDLFSLASRLALIDALYDKDLPPLIFDDPAAALDDARFEQAKQLLTRLSATRQILYFTCADSRKI